MRLHLAGTAARSSSTTRRTLIGEASPEEIVEEDYRLQRLVYALACFRAGAEEVEVVYHFLERPDAPRRATFTLAEVAELEAELSAAIARIQAGEFRPTPSDFACAGCPALDLVCAGPRLSGGAGAAGANPGRAPDRRARGPVTSSVRGARHPDVELVARHVHSTDAEEAARASARPDTLLRTCPGAWHRECVGSQEGCRGRGLQR